MQHPFHGEHGHSVTWPSVLIRETLPSLGYVAWQGYLSQGRGLVACQILRVSSTILDWRYQHVPCHLQYIRAATVPAYLQAHDLAPYDIEPIMIAIQNYQPQRELLLLLSHQGQVEIVRLQNLAIAPPDCHRQVCDRWAEFMLSPTSTSSPSERGSLDE